MKRHIFSRTTFRRLGLLSALAIAATLTSGALGAFELNVVDQDGVPVSGFRWVVEEDTTHWVEPGVSVSDSISINIHNSYAPVADTGQAVGSSAMIEVDDTKRYFVSILPDSASSSGGHTLGGAPVAPGQASVTVLVNSLPLPTTQISVFVFRDDNAINNAPDLGAGTGEEGLPGFKIIVNDAAGQAIQDAFGNQLGTTYLKHPDGTFDLDVDGQPKVDTPGNGFITSGPDGYAYIKNLPQNKFGILIEPPTTDGLGNPVEWIQTTTIEGTPVVDAWVKPDGSRLLSEFGGVAPHIAIGFINPAELPWAIDPPGGSGEIIGEARYVHYSRPPQASAFFPGEPVSDCWVGLNSNVGEGLIAQPCNPDSTFSIAGVPPGDYQLVVWDLFLDQIIGFHTVTVPEGGGLVDMGQLLEFRWFGTLQGRVFSDANQNGFPDPGEGGLADQAVLLRYRDGRIYKMATSEPDGSYVLSEVFPFFHWLVVEVDYASRKATGATFAVDDGGEIPLDDGWTVPSRDKLNPQDQAAANPHTGNNLSRTETGVLLTQAMMLFGGQTNVIDWGKIAYQGEENGGISGIVHYAVTRAEDDPRLAAAEDWEPGVPRVQVALYQDLDLDAVIDDLDDNPGPTLADVDNYPFGFIDGEAPGDEDLDRNLNGSFDAGDAINVAWTDSWDDAKPADCLQAPLFVNGQQTPECFDNFATFNQLRPGVFDGGYAFDSYFPGGMDSGSDEVVGLPTATYIVEASAPPQYKHLKEEDRNVDFGDPYTPSLKAAGDGGEEEALPAACVGDLRVVPDYLSLFPDQMIPAGFAGMSRPLCDRKHVRVAPGLNAAADFFLFTDVPVAAHGVGLINNDLAAETRVQSPVLGEKAGPSWIPVAFIDAFGHEVSRVYSDEFGAYNALLPSTYTVNVPAPTGVSAGILSVCLNHPYKPDPSNPGETILDPWYDPNYGLACYNLNFEPGGVTYLDTPVVPVGAFVDYPVRRLDVEAPDGVPGVASVDGAGGGSAVCAADEVITITSLGMREVPNPAYDPSVPGSPTTVLRDYGFGPTIGRVTLNGTDLPIVSWSDATIQTSVPGGSPSGQLLVQRGDNDTWSETGLTLHVGECSPIRVPADYATIQAAVDAASPGDLILVAPGEYRENVIVGKPVRLQGAGFDSTVISAYPVPDERIDNWHVKLSEILGGADTAAFQTIQTPAVMLLDAGGGFTAGRIDGFTLTGASSGGGLYVYDGVHDSEVSNNLIMGNQASYSGGISVGVFGEAHSNTNLWVHHNRIVKNSGNNGAGGISLFEGSTDYSVTDNVIAGNLCRFYGGGISHMGLSDGGLIVNNKIRFNEIFNNAPIGSGGGGIYISSNNGLAGPGTGVAGNVTIIDNRIQGNLAGSSSGGGIAIDGFNGADITPGSAPEDWYTLKIFNNIITNNVAAMEAGGILLQDVTRAFIIHNTVVQNDSTATASAAFTGNLIQSEPQIAGLVSRSHSQALADAMAAAGYPETFSNPVLDNNILWQNRSFYWDSTLNNGKGNLVLATPNQFRDLGVNSTNPLDMLEPRFSALTDTTGYDPSNAEGTAIPDDEFTFFNKITGASTTDEAGNQITLRFTPLTVDNQAYRLRIWDPLIPGDPNDPTPVSSALAIGSAMWMSLFPELSLDIDGDVRTIGLIDAGADDVALKADANCDLTVDGADIARIVQVIFGGDWMCREDVNYDGVVDSLDVAAVINASPSP